MRKILYYEGQKLNIDNNEFMKPYSMFIQSCPFYFDSQNLKDILKILFYQRSPDHQNQYHLIICLLF